MFIPIYRHCRCRIENIKTTEKLKFLSDILEKDLSPQEKEAELMKQLHITEEKAKNLIEHYQIIRKNTQNVEEYIKKVGNEYCVFSHQTGKNFGCYKSKDEAEKRLAQIHVFK
jgi:hypothetical protein